MYIVTSDDGSVANLMPQMTNISNAIIQKFVWMYKYRKCVISTRGYFFFQASWGAGYIQERAQFKSGYYWKTSILEPEKYTI